MAFVPGVKSTFDNNGSTSILEIADGLKYLNPKADGLALLKRIGMNGFTFANHKYEWRETVLAPRKETVTLADGSGTTLTVADAYVYQKNALLRIEAEVVRVTAIASATTLTITRGYAGTTGAAHSAKPMIPLGTAMPEGADASDGLSDNGSPLYNYDQIFERAVALTNHEIAALGVEGNPLPKQLARRMIEIHREIFQAAIYGVRYQDTTNEIYAMGGIKQATVTNVTNVAGALTNAPIDAIILAIVQAGGDPKTISLSPYQKQKLDALDANLIRTGKRKDLGGGDHVGGGSAIMTWQSGVLDHDLDIIVDHSFLDSELYINDLDHIKIGMQSNNGVSGAIHVEDSTKPGANRQERVIRADVGIKVELEKGQGYLYGLT
jgi:hypothetical protein